jgi:hypothetical protein
LIFIRTADRSAINAAHVTRLFVRKASVEKYELCASITGPQMPYLLATYPTDERAFSAMTFIIIQMNEYKGGSNVNLIMAPDFHDGSE